MPTARTDLPMVTIEADYLAGVPAATLATRYRVHPATIHRRLAERGVHRNAREASALYAARPTLGPGSLEDLAADLDTDPARLQALLHMHGFITAAPPPPPAPSGTLTRYSPQFKADAIARHQATPNKPIKETARELGIHPKTLSHWLRSARTTLPHPDTAPPPGQPDSHDPTTSASTTAPRNPHTGWQPENAREKLPITTADHPNPAPTNPGVPMPQAQPLHLNDRTTLVAAYDNILNEFTAALWVDGKPAAMHGIFTPFKHPDDLTDSIDEFLADNGVEPLTEEQTRDLEALLTAKGSLGDFALLQMAKNDPQMFGSFGTA